MASTGATTPGTGSDVTYTFGAMWAGPSGITSLGGGTAAANPFDGPTNYLQGTNFGFSFPGGASIVGFEVVWNRALTGGSGVTDFEIKLMKAGSTVGSNKSTGATWGASGSVVFGGSTDLWGTTWSPSDVTDSGFGCSLQCTGPFGSSVEVQFLTIEVFYAVVTPSVPAFGKVNRIRRTFPNVVRSLLPLICG